MNGDSRRPSSLAVAVSGLIGLLSIVGCFVTLRASSEHEHQLLVDETQQAALLMENDIGSFYSTMNSVATAATLAVNDPAQFSKLAVTLTAVRNSSIVLVKQQGASYVVIGAVGPAFHVGQQLGGAIARTLATAGGTVTPAPVVHSNGTSTLGFALGPPTTPNGMAVYEQLSVRVRVGIMANTTGPFNSLNFVLYGGPTIDPHHLVLDNTKSVPLTGETAEASVPVGAATWLAVASARGTLSGYLAEETGWIILLMGLLIALLVGVMVDGLSLRQRYAEEQVELRTAELAQSMTHLKEAQAALVQRERLAAVGQMASVVGHELRNPLTAVTNALYLIRASLRTGTPDAASGHLELAEREAHRAATLAQDLTDFVRPRRPVPEPFRLNQLFEEVMQTSSPPVGVTVRAHVGRVIVVADRVQVGELLTNLVTNAYQAVGNDGHVWVWANPEGDMVKLWVQDDGPGIDPEVASKIFEPFVTTRTRGTGLGLAIVRRIVEEHRGTVGIEPTEGPGTRIVATLPGAAEQNGEVDRGMHDETGVWIGGEEGGPVNTEDKAPAEAVWS